MVACWSNWVSSVACAFSVATTSPVAVRLISAVAVCTSFVAMASPVAVPTITAVPVASACASDVACASLVAMASPVAVPTITAVPVASACASDVACASLVATASAVPVAKIASPCSTVAVMVALASLVPCTLMVGVGVGVIVGVKVGVGVGITSITKSNVCCASAPPWFSTSTLSVCVPLPRMSRSGKSLM